MFYVMRGIGAAAILSVASCGGSGGGGGGGAGLTLTVSPTTLTFFAGNANAPKPAPQTVSAFVSGTGSGNLYIVINSTGPAVASIDSFVLTTALSGEANVNPASPATLGVGTFKSTITIHVCLNDSTCKTGEIGGSPATVDVTYRVLG